MELYCCDLQQLAASFQTALKFEKDGFEKL